VRACLVVVAAAACSPPAHPRAPVAAASCRPIAAVADVSERFERAHHALLARCYAQATLAFVSIWEYSGDDIASRIVHRMKLPLDLAELVHAFPAARPAIAALRDTVAPPRGREPAPDQLTDWIQLEVALDETAAVLDWLDTEDRAIVGASELADTLETYVIPLLIERDRWATAGALYREPIRSLRVERYTWPTFDEHAHLRLRERATTMVRALLAAGRLDDAGAVERELERIDPQQVRPQ
jgi:hypothetical protein